MGVIGSKEYNDMLEGYRNGASWLNDVKMEIVDGENELDPLILLRAYEQEPTVDNQAALASQFILNKQVRFIRNGKELLSFVYTGGDLGVKFKKAPYLLDVLLKTAYALMIKKLTPPSENLNEEEPQMAAQEKV